jgi:dephospho-CoA kinase
MLTVGLTGGIGSGKTTVAELFAQQGVPVIDTDRIAHELTASNGAAMPSIREQFGNRFLHPDGSLDRSHMRQIVFADSAARTQLEVILHPLIRREVEAQLKTINAPYVLVVIPLLVEKGGYADLLDRVLVVDCSPELQITRAMARSTLAREGVEAIMRTQASREHRLSQADEVILNEGAVAELTDPIQALNAKYHALARGKL